MFGSNSQSSSSTQNSMTISKRFGRLFAQVEAHLSTYALLQLFLVFYAAVNLLMFLYGFHGEIVLPSNIANGPVMPYIIGVARGAGYTLNINTAFVILLASRYLFTKLRDTSLSNVLPFDKAFPMLHIIAGYSITIGVIVHASFHLGWLIPFGGWSWGLWSINMSVITGGVLLITLLTMLFFLRPAVRKNNFQTFYRVHIIGAIIFFTVLIFHGMYRDVPETYKFITPPLIIYILDRILRRLHASVTTLQLSSANSLFKDDNVLELRVPKPFKYQSGQYAELQIPSINREWHPFTIASAPHEETLALYIKKLGDWTGALHEAFASRLEGGESETITVRVRGPYGAPCQHVRGYDRVVLISGGIGSTPFSAVCKDLHHLNIHDQARQHSTVEKSNDTLLHSESINAAENSMYKSISKLYSVNVDAAVKHISAVDEQRSALVTDMLHLSALNHEVGNKGLSKTDSSDFEKGYYAGQEDTTSSSSSESDSENEKEKVKTNEVPSKKQIGRNDSIFVSSSKAIPRARQRMIHLLSGSSRVLAFLHSTQVQFFLLVSLIARMTVICIGSIWKSSYVSVLTDSSKEKGEWTAIADTALSGIVGIVIPLTVAIEISFMGYKYFSRRGRVLDLIFLVPAAIGSPGLGSLELVMSGKVNRGVTVVHYLVLLPLMFVLLLNRLHSTLGGRRLTDTTRKCNCDKHSEAPDVDFVWTTPRSNDDLWLRQELEPLASGSELRLHRYVTREKEIDEEMGMDGDFRSNTKLGRPDWDWLFTDVASRSSSESTVGVFFCGPHKMGEAIRNSIRKVEVVSALKGAYLRGVSKETISKDLGVEKQVVKILQQKGSSVRFAFREENFG